MITDKRLGMRTLYLAILFLGFVIHLRTGSLCNDTDSSLQVLKNENKQRDSTLNEKKKQLRLRTSRIDHVRYYILFCNLQTRTEQTKTQTDKQATM